MQAPLATMVSPLGKIGCPLPHTPLEDQEGQADMIIWLIWLCLMGGVQSYQMQYQDCWDPTRLERFMENTACAAEHTPGEQPGKRTYAVLTEAHTKELAGWR